MTAERLPGGPVTAAIALALAVLYGCSSSSGAKPITVAPGGASTTTPASPATSTAVTEPIASQATLQSILLRPADMPGGFAAAPAADTGDDVLTLRACGQMVVRTGAVREAKTVVVRSSDHVRVAERVNAYASASAASVPVGFLRAVGVICHETGVSTLSPPAVGEEVAGMQVPGTTGIVDVVLIRSGPLVAAVVITGPGPIADATMQAVVHAAGTKLAVGTGG